MEFYNKVSELINNNIPFVTATVIKTSGSTPGKVGFKLIVTGDNFSGTIGGGALEVEIIKEAKNILSSNSENFTKEYILSDKPEFKDDDAQVIPMMCSGKIWIYYEVNGRFPEVYIYGGGHVGHSLLYFLNPLPYYKILIDNRAGFAAEEKNPFANKYIFSEYNLFLENLNPKPDSFHVILTHGHVYDYDIAYNLYKKNINFNYVGIISSKSKSERIKEKLRESLNNSIDLSNLYSPIGLPVVGNTAEEIALSIASQIQAVNYKQKKFRI